MRAASGIRSVLVASLLVLAPHGGRPALLPYPPQESDLGDIRWNSPSKEHPAVVVVLAEDPVSSGIRRIARQLSAFGLAVRLIPVSAGLRPSNAGEADNRLAASRKQELAQAGEIVARILDIRNDVPFAQIAVATFDSTETLGSLVTMGARTDAWVRVREAAPRPAEGLRESQAPDIGIPELAVSVESRSGNSVHSAATAIAKFVKGATTFHPATRKSKRTAVLARVGHSVIAVEHGQPLKRGRSVWAHVVPQKQWWMPGADEATTFTTSIPLGLEDSVLPAGAYSIYWLPGDPAHLVFNGSLGQYHNRYEPALNVAIVKMKREDVEAPSEALTFDIMDGGPLGRLVLKWDNRAYSVPFTVCAATGVMGESTPVRKGQSRPC